MSIKCFTRKLPCHRPTIWLKNLSFLFIWMGFTSSFVQQPVRPRQISAFLATQQGNDLLFASVPSKQQIVIKSFIDNAVKSLQQDTFVELNIRGPSKKSAPLEELRGSFRLVFGRLIVLDSIEKRRLQMTFKYHGATDIVKNWELDQTKEGLESLFLSKNSNLLVPDSEWGGVWYAPGTALGIQSASLTTMDATFELDLSSRRRKPRLVRKAASTVAERSLAHDRQKRVPLQNTAADFWRALGVTQADGKPRTGMGSKLRQCQKFVEIVGNLVASVDNTNVSVVDMGCGRAYLTFALHAYLSERYSVKSLGIDVRPKLVAEISQIARSLGPAFESLSFEQGTIQDAIASLASRKLHPSDDDSLNVLIALHACDTATDDALWCGIVQNADVIVVAPCCHKQVRPQLDKHTSPNHPLVDVLRHNIYREHMAEMVTDSIRAMLLEIAGYNVQVFEFIGGEHTSKNVMITATKRQPARTPKEQEDLQYRLNELMGLHGVREHKLLEWMVQRPTNDSTKFQRMPLPRRL